MTNETRTTTRRLLALALALGMVGLPMNAGAPPPPPPPPPPGTITSGDDIFLLTASTAPNVILLMDNSKSMQHIEWHPAFDPSQAPDASYCASSADFGGALDPDAEYVVSGTINNANCDSPARGNHKVWGPGVGDPDYIWSGRYLMWYLGLPDASPILSEIATAEANVEGCTQAGGAKDFDQKYRRSRLEASKQVLLDLLCVAESKNVRFGLAYYRETEDAGDADPNGGFVVEDLGRSNPNHAAELEAALKNVTVNDDDVEATPLAESLFQIYTYWMSRDLADIPLGRDGATQFPRYQYDKFGTWETNSSQWLEDPLLYECEKAFVVIVTDGLPTRDDFDEETTASEAAGFTGFGNLIGDYHDDGADGAADAEVPGDAAESSQYLDDIAAYMQDHDFRPDLANDQVVDTYAIGLATDPTTDAFLQKTAELGNGLFFHTQDGDQLQFALIAALNDIIEKAASFTAAAVPSARTADGGDFYQSFFIPQRRSAYWEGHIRAWKIALDGSILDENDDCALEDPDAGECNSGPFKPEAVYFWDALEEVPQPASRSLYASKLVSGTPTRVAFDDTLTAADLGLQAFTAAPDPAPNNALYPVQGSNALSAEGLADEVVAYARGCFFGTGVTDVSLTSLPQACLARPSRLGDVFHSNLVVVRQPASFIFEPSYEAFKDAYATRSRRIYAGTNAGFLEAIDAGTWQAAATPPAYDKGTGAEIFGFMPWAARQTIRKFPVDSPLARSHYVDGSPQVADVWIHPSATATSKNADGREWRTMLVGGLRRGGRHYFALDVTNPDGINGPGGVNLEYPGFQAGGPAYGWEFPEEGDPDAWLPYMGETWGQPIVTRVKVDVNGDGVPRERWVAVVSGGFDFNGDPSPTGITGTASIYDDAETEGRSIFLIDMKTGGVLARKTLDSGASDAQADMLYATPSAPAVFDLNGDGFADVIVAGNLGGQMFKWVVNGLGGDPINGSAAGDDEDQPNWPFVLFFEAPIEDIAGDDYHQNFYFPAAGAMSNGKLWLAFAAGQRRYLGYEGSPGPPGTAWTAGSDDENNRLYVVFDPDPLELLGLGTVTEADLVDATNSPGGVSLSSERGFFLRAEDGEKFVTNTVIFAGYVVTSSFTPTPSLDPCAARGLGTAYVLDLLTGEGFFRDGSNNPTPRLDLGVGLPTDPKISVGLGGTGGGGGGGPCGTGQGNRVYIEKSGADLASFEACDIPTGGQLLYWRER